jgi:hypothetical protein
VRPRIVESIVNYIGEMSVRPRFYANDHSRDNLILDPRRVMIEDARATHSKPSLTREGFVILPHKSDVRDFRDRDEVARLYPGETERLILELTGADRVIVTGPGILRFGERSKEAGTLSNSWPARFIHIDLTEPVGEEFAARALPGGKDALKRKRRYAHYNVWRALSPPPQDVPLAVCDARSLSPDDLVVADAVFDEKDRPAWGFDSYLVRYSPTHRWVYYADMHRDEALIFKTYDSDPGQPCHCPHSAFDDPSCPRGVPPRMSIEIRAIAYFDA